MSLVSANENDFQRLHAHSCPECYEHVPCTMACTIEPDLGLTEVVWPPTGRKVMVQFGTHCTCEECLELKIRAAVERDRRLVYDGFVRTERYEQHLSLAKTELERGAKKGR